MTKRFACAVRALVAVAILAGLMPGSVSAQRSRWQMSQSADVRLGVRDYENRAGGLVVLFVVKGPDGREYRTEKRSSDVGDWLYASFPEDFRADAQPGRYAWVGVVDGAVVARGAFEYKTRFEVRVSSPADATGGATGPPDDVQRRARIAKAQADVRSIASAVSLYAAHMGVLPRSLRNLTQSTRNRSGQTSGPVLRAVPDPPRGWTPYAYSATAEGMFTVESSGDGTTARVP